MHTERSRLCGVILFMLFWSGTLGVRPTAGVTLSHEEGPEAANSREPAWEIFSSCCQESETLTPSFSGVQRESAPLGKKLLAPSTSESAVKKNTIPEPVYLLAIGVWLLGTGLWYNRSKRV